MHDLFPIPVLILIGVVTAAGCTSSSRGDDRSPPPEAPDDLPPAHHKAPPADAPAVVIESSTGDEVKVYVEVVKTRRAITRGLMYREHLAPDAGMLFLMNQTKVHTFWMRNTLISLDMIFIAKDKTIAGIVEHTTPLSDQTRYVDKPSHYVLEVNAGWSEAHHVGAGAKVRFENVVE